MIKVKNIHTVRVRHTTIITGEVVPSEGWLAYPEFSIHITGCADSGIAKDIITLFKKAEELRKIFNESH
jgi:hypothetical protein